jgi:hypothetical protein
MRVKHLAQKNKMGKSNTANSATSWVPSDFKQKDLDKAQADGLISDDDQVTFPSTERIPKPPSGFRVMFFFCFSLAQSVFPRPQVPSWASFRVWCAASPAHTKLDSPHCLFYYPLRVVFGDRTLFSSLEIPLSAPPQCRFIKET